MISSHVKITCYLHTWKDHHCYGYIINRAFRSIIQNVKLTWYFIGVYIINRTYHGHLEIQNFSSHVIKHFWNIVQHSKINFVSPRGHVISSIYSNQTWLELPSVGSIFYNFPRNYNKFYERPHSVKWPRHVKINIYTLYLNVSVSLLCKFFGGY